MFIGIGAVYLALISIFGFLVFVCTLTPNFHMPARRKLRGSMFLILGVSTSIPIFHLIFFGKYVSGFEKVPKFYYWEIGGIIYIIGGLFFVTRIPEKYFPNKFDYCLHSHNNLHICVVIAFIIQYFGALDSYYYRVDYKCPAN